jgi:hypothetical protein
MPFRNSKAILVLCAVAKLAHDGEQVRLMEPPRLLVQPARRPEVGELEFDPGILDAVAQHVERAAPLDFGSEAFEELLLHRRAVVLLELLPFLRLRREDKVRHVAWDETQGAVVVLGAALAIEARRDIAVGPLRR